MFKVVLYWMLGMLTLSVGLGVVVILLAAYEFFFLEYMLVSYAVLFVALPIGIGVVTELVSDWSYNRRVKNKLKRMEETQND